MILIGIKCVPTITEKCVVKNVTSVVYTVDANLENLET